MANSFSIDPRLAAETHIIGDLPLSRLLLMNDARFPWVILVPRICGARELIDLDSADQKILLAEINHISHILESVLRPDKLNIAALGNMIPQLHIHIIARYTDDAAWPRPVWAFEKMLPYIPEKLAGLMLELRAELGVFRHEHGYKII